MANCGGDVAEIPAEVWVVAEATGKQVVEWVQPTLDAEEKRRDVIEYLQKLLRTSLGIEFYPYGSVPLKTYLPDGDIDLTAITTLPSSETLPHKVFAVIQELENNHNDEYFVKDTNLIDARVKLVKCLVDDIVIDLSFNQLGGISTLCFLEEVDRYVGKNHLFKRSLILVKAWCFYESHILGSHHGLMSTYAMETLVLYIFQLFHASLEGPLMVLYKFLNYFSKFDWDHYCISLNGPVSKSSLPDKVVDMAHSVQNGYLFSEEFLRNCIDMFSVPFADAESQIFNPKHLNIIDPLKENNNLGRSVSLGNFNRIQSAFRYGAQNLARIFTLPRESIADAIKKFFANTFQRHGHKRIELTQPFYSRSLAEENTQINTYSLYPESNTGGVFSSGYLSDRNFTPVASWMRHPMGDMGSPFLLSAGEMYSGPANYQFDCSTPAWYPSDSVSHYYASHYQSYAENSNSLIGDPRDNYDRLSNYGSSFMTLDGSSSEDLALNFEEKEFVDIAERYKSSNLLDLTGDYDNNIRSLVYGQHCHGHPLCTDRMANPFNSFNPQFKCKRPWTPAPQSMSMTHCSSSYTNGVNFGLAPYPTFIPGQFNAGLYIEENYERPPGIGAYVPKGYTSRERASSRRRRSRGPDNYQHYQHPGSALIVPEKKASEERRIDYGQLPKTPSPVLRLENHKIPKESSNSSAFDVSETSDFITGTQKVELRSLTNLSDGTIVGVSETYSDWDSVLSQVKSAEPLSGSNLERVEKQPYQHKDEDFPPLTDELHRDLR